MKKKYTITINPQYFWKFFVPGVLIALVVGGISAVLVIDMVVMPNIVGVNRDIVTVPDIVGKDLEAGRDVLYKAGLLTEIRSREYDNKLTENAIVSQFPEAGSKVKKNRRIAVTVSKGKPVAVIPDVRNQTERQARIEMKKAGLSIGKIKKTYHDEKPVDIIIQAFPECGTTVSRDLEIDLIISKGPKPTTADVPNLVGESISEARKKIEESNLVVGKISYENNSSLLPGTIVSQSVSPGTNVPFESAIDLVVSVIR
ncbi:MAG: PASTA domain-containing protein [Fibrobacter sp.]|nr:PASTA domain-containing protein [Fibrobacter sp.]